MDDVVLGVYKLLDRCGEGAYGEVYLAENVLTGGRFALKILSPRRENRELGGLIRCRECRHENLIRIHHIDRTADGRLYYTMDAADNAANVGEKYTPDTLARRLERTGALPAAEIKKLAGALLSGLDALHRSGLIHRDIKPENILFVGGTPVLGDIGLAAFAASASLIGTPAFIRPEVLSGKRPFDERSDLYALGMVIYCALTGWPPEKYPHLPDDLPPVAADVLEFCRAACSGAADIGELRAILAGKPSPFRSRHRAVLILAASALLAVSAAAAWYVLSTRRTESAPSAVTPLPVPAAPERELTPREWIRERDRLFAKYAIPDDFRAKCAAHYKAVEARSKERFAQQLREHPEAVEAIQREWRREQMRLHRSDPLYAVGECDDMLELCLKIWDPELVEVTQAQLNGFEKFLKERYEFYRAATTGK